MPLWVLAIECIHISSRQGSRGGSGVYMVFLPVFLSVFFPVARHIALSRMGGLICL